jgi:hypothetical protein
LQEAVTAILRKYVDVYYRCRHEKWDSDHLVYRRLDIEDPNLAFHRSDVQEKKTAYNVCISGSRQDLISAIEKLRADMDRLIKEENSGLPRIYFDRSLYLPLLVKKGSQLTVDPPPLEESEAQFVRDLKVYWEEKKDKLAGREVYLLRNLSRGKASASSKKAASTPISSCGLLTKTIRALFSSSRMACCIPKLIYTMKKRACGNACQTWRKRLVGEVGSGRLRLTRISSQPLPLTIYINDMMMERGAKKNSPRNISCLWNEISNMII